MHGAVIAYSWEFNLFGTLKMSSFAYWASQATVYKREMEIHLDQRPWLLWLIIVMLSINFTPY